MLGTEANLKVHTWPAAVLAVMQMAALFVAAQSPPSGSDLFAGTPVWRLRLEISSEGLASLRKDSRQYVRATVYESTNVLRDVAVRLKGRTGSFRGLEAKPSFTINCDHFITDHRFHGLTKIHLNNSVEDPSYLNEKLGAELFRCASIPAPRVCHALVELNGRRLGLYVLKEGFEREFLAAHFKRTDGNLYEPELGEGCDVTGPMKRNSGSGAEDRSDLQRLAAASTDPDLSRRWARVTGLLDVDRFVSFMAMEAMSGHRDGYCVARNNYRLYHDPASDRFVFLPSGMDQLFGNPGFPIEPRMFGVVARGVIETPEGRRAYRQRSAMLFTNCVKPDALVIQVRNWSTAISSHLTRTEARAMEREASDFCERIRQRATNIAGQLAEPVLEPVQFQNDAAHPGPWRPMNSPAGSQLEQTVLSGITTLHIQAGPSTAASWQTKVLLDPGRYRFEGLVRTAGVKRMSFGRTHGASLAVRGAKASAPQFLIADSDWTKVQLDFEVSDTRTELALLCSLRASAGDAWFDLNSLQLVRLR